jgi:phytoene dehydrogenase-like protein
MFGVVAHYLSLCKNRNIAAEQDTGYQLSLYLYRKNIETLTLGKTKINIIGAGISGLSAGCYLQMNGFDTEIFEKHSNSGGLCTSWKKGDYTFDGCIQWLLGSNDSNPFYRIWSELIDMPSIEFINHEVRMDIEVENNTDKYGEKVFHLYTNLDKLEIYMTDIARGDERTIRQFIRSMRKIQGYEIPPMIDKNPNELSFIDKMRFIRHLPLLLFLHRWKKITNNSFARRFKNPFLREVFELLFDGDEMPLLIISLPLAFNDKKGTGYPVGGSSAFAKRIEERYLSLGGRINYHAGVSKIIVENDTAIGLLLESGEQSHSEITLSAADWHFTVFDALDGRYTDKSICELGLQKRLPVFYSVILVSLGVSRNFSGSTHFLRFPLEEELNSPDGTIYRRMEAHINNYDPTLAPEGKTVISFCFYTKNSDFWIGLRKSDFVAYSACKKDFAGKVIEIAEKRFGNIRNHLEEFDIATPATFNRYTNNWKGSTQGWLPGKNLIERSPVQPELPGLKNFYFSGHWTTPGGGLPVAVKSARDVAQMICRKQKVRFRVLFPSFL